ncbi:MAG TPA: hypothetical protein VI359_02240 [Nitrospiraceae bacterium]
MSESGSVVPAKDEDEGEIEVGRNASIILAWLAVLVMTPTLGSAQTGSLSNSPTEVVKRYLGLDIKGARLESMSVDALQPYISWKEEPLWSRAVVTQDFMVAEDYRQWEVVDRMEVVIPVTFHVMGLVYFETAGFVSKPETEEVRFRVKAIKNRWKIVDPLLPPHVGQKRIVNFVREAWIKETDSEKRAALATLQEELRKAK